VSAIDHKIPPPLVMIVVAGGMLGVSPFLGASPIPASVRWSGALLLFGLAAVMGAPAVRSFRRAQTTINTVAIERASTLVTNGVYGISRNPMYVSLTLLLLALAAGLGQPILLVGPLLFVLFIDRFQILPEEQAMDRLFGAEYRSYKARVRRWL
jgi:protein-S-isoprenylcysteine O-methyltransferase Ste14